ncbi:hypothetical protein C8K30_102136 [Promicromonospora sp. AC04]|uniref:hypothetical protein n=1 Tax=Promicromonospora sp. AC04 TaxID=2135723 RepID=UPI000D3F23FA|nr:hypothetical protein [Promicromonospora sp. AC04]PUB29761.1 hypothetical protein C8K30_102136 [Promicromonospora sp. AC04]
MGHTEDTRRAALEVTLAEFNALRSEMVARVSAQTASIGISVTAFGAFFSFGDDTATTFIPIAAMSMSLLSVSNWYWILFLGMYIRRDIWPRLQELGEQTDSPGWERFAAGHALKPKFVLLGTFFEFAAPATFFVFAILSIFRSPPSGAWMWVTDIICIIATLAAPAWIALTFHFEARNEPPLPAEHEGPSHTAARVPSPT